MPETLIEAKLQTFSAKYIIDTLLPYLSERRQQRINKVLERRLSSIQLVLESPCDINNAFAILRTCECFGIQTLHVIKPEGEATCIRRLTRGAMYWVDIQQYDSFEQFIHTVDRKHCVLAGGTLNISQSITQVPVDQPLYLLLGNERSGLSLAAQQACDIRYQIPMCGMSDSLNLSASAAISLYDTSQRKRALLQAAGDVDADTKLALTARYYLNSVNSRLIQGLLPAE